MSGEDAEKPRGRGRPTVYTDELGLQIAKSIADGLSLRRICEPDGMPGASTIVDWALNPKHPFAEQYTKARQIQAERMAAELIEIADDGTNDWMRREDPDNPGYTFNGEHYQRSRLRLDTRKWYLSKMLPKVYGERIQIDAKTTTVPATAEDLIREAAAVGLTAEQLFGRQPGN